MLDFTIQLNGYCHVIGALWPVNDWSARTISTSFYDRLLSGSSIPNTATFAVALQTAVVET